MGLKGHGWESIDSTIKKSPFKDDIKIVGWVTEAEKHTLLSNAAVFISVSAYEGFGLPLLEAMDSATPIVTSDQASLPEIAGDAAIIVPRGNKDAIMEAVRTIVLDAEKRTALITAGKRRVTQFTWEETAQLTMTALESLIAKR